LTFIVAIVGSRTFGECACYPSHFDSKPHHKGCAFPSYHSLVSDIVAKLRSEYPDLRIISGRARGADTLAELCANEQHVHFTPFPPDPKLGVPGLFARNQQMADTADMVIALFAPGPKTHGTQDMIDRAVRAGKATWSLWKHQWTCEV
jgi:hypothetical protein